MDRKRPATPTPIPAPATMKPTVAIVPVVEDESRSDFADGGQRSSRHSSLSEPAFDSVMRPVTVPTARPARAVPKPT